MDKIHTTLGTIADNWSLQNISELFEEGLDQDSAQYIEPDVTTDTHRYAELPQAIIQTEALFDFLSDLVLREEILVDSDFANAWQKPGSPLTAAGLSGIVRPFAFKEHIARFLEPRDALVNQLCVTGSLKEEHSLNTATWQAEKRTPYPILSQALWGGAGMLARAHVFERCYTPHPVRKRLFLNTRLLEKQDGAMTRIGQFVRTKRAQVAEAYMGNNLRLAMQFDIDPIPLMIINESSSATDLIPVALQYRKELAEFRQWLAQYQDALLGGDFSDIQPFQDTLDSVSKYVDSKMGIPDPDAATFTIGLEYFNIPLNVKFKANPVNAVRNRLGTRAILNKLILKGPGVSSFKKYLGFFDNPQSSLSRRLVDHFSFK